MEQKRCMRCMNLKSGSPFCEHCGFDERTQNNPHQLPIGTVLKGQYLVGKVLGQGGFGITYVGFDQFLQTPVAIKEYYPNGFVMRDAAQTTVITRCENVSDSVFEKNRERFLREAQSLAKLSNVPEVVRVQNFFAENGTAYIIMEFLQGQTLKDYVKQYGALSAEWVLNTLRPVMQGLQRVHEAGIVHRDISPDNIMVLPGGTVKLLDFGAVRDYSVSVTHNTQAILKPGFAPPEQYQQNGNIGPWTDVYAFCATLFYCMTGYMCPDAPKRMMEGIHPDWTRIPGLTPAQVAALQQGMALLIQQRVQTMGDLVNGLFYASSYQPAVQQPISQVQQPVSQVQSGIQSQVSEEALARAREWKRQQAEKKEQERLQQEHAQRLAEERAQREALLREQQLRNGGNSKGPIKKLITIVGAVLAVVIGLALLIPTGEDEPAENDTGKSTVAEPKSEQSPEQKNFGKGTLAYPESGSKYDNLSCEIRMTDDGMVVEGESLHIAFTDQRSVVIDVGSLIIDDSYLINYEGSQENYTDVQWSVTMIGDEEEVSFCTSITSDGSGDEKWVTPEEMNDYILYRVSETNSESFAFIEEIDYDRYNFHWRSSVPETSNFDYNKDLEIPFDFRNFHTFRVFAYDKRNDITVMRTYTAS